MPKYAIDPNENLVRVKRRMQYHANYKPNNKTLKKKLEPRMALISFLLSWGVRKGTQENKFQEKKILHKSHELDMRKMKTWHNFKQLMKCEKKSDYSSSTTDGSLILDDNGREWTLSTLWVYSSTKCWHGHNDGYWFSTKRKIYLLLRTKCKC